MPKCRRPMHMVHYKLQVYRAVVNMLIILKQKSLPYKASGQLNNRVWANLEAVPIQFPLL